MGTIRDKMRDDLDLRGFASTTKKEYLRRAQNFVAYYHRPPTELGEREVREFLLYLVIAEIRKHTVVVPGCFAQPERLLGRRPRGLRVAQLEQALTEVAVSDRPVAISPGAL